MGKSSERTNDASVPALGVVPGLGETGGGAGTKLSPPDPEVAAKAARRSFNAEYKQRILREADA